MTLQIEVKDDFADEIIKVLKSFKNKIISINANEFDINMQKSIDDLKNKRVKKFNINEFLKDVWDISNSNIWKSSKKIF